MAKNSFSIFPRFSDPCEALIHLRGLMGPGDLGGRSEVADHEGPEAQHQDVRV